MKLLERLFMRGYKIGTGLALYKVEIKKHFKGGAQ